eukprot:Lithocolla_globosa_v1_NODE_5765_length_1188_cov_5.898500.p1 type:complete len:300 gc:universal NODE_5765_length_1188_cov_5.898500:161-1060(+)
MGFNCSRVLSSFPHRKKNFFRRKMASFAFMHEVVQQHYPTMPDEVKLYMSDDNNLRIIYDSRKKQKEREDVLLKTLQYVVEFGSAWNFDMDTCQFCKEQGKLQESFFILGQDLKGRGIIYLFEQYFPHTPSEYAKDPHVLQHFVYHLRRINEMNNVPENMVFIHDYYAMHISRLPGLSGCKKYADVVQSLFRDRLGLYMLLDTPRPFGVLWKLLSPFLKKKTHEKVKFSNGENCNLQDLSNDFGHEMATKILHLRSQLRDCSDNEKYEPQDMSRVIGQMETSYGKNSLHKTIVPESCSN